jgi:RNA polymerase sigma-70 factor, ECF subfamily
MDLSEEKGLVSRCRDDPAAFGRIYEEYYGGIYRYVLKRTGNVKIAEDITSETFFKALKHIGKFKWRNVPFSSWLYRIATNEVNSFFRQGKYKTVSLDELDIDSLAPVSPADIEAEIEEADNRLQQHADYLQALEQVKKLPIKYQTVIALRFFENKKINEICDILGKKEGTVKSLLSRGLDILRKNRGASQE